MCKLYNECYNFEERDIKQCIYHDCFVSMEEYARRMELERMLLKLSDT